MKDKGLQDTFNDLSNQDLTFTKEDRNKVFERLHSTEKSNIQKRSLISISKKFAPLTASILAVSLCLFLFIPTIFQGNVNTENNGLNTNGVVSPEDELFTALLTVKDENNRLPLNLLLTYSKGEKLMKVASIPRDTYAPILDKKDGATPYDKLSHAYINGTRGAEDVRITVSNLFDLPIDYYAIVDLETLSIMVDSVNGIEYDLQEDMQVRAISQVAFEFKKGTHRLNGEEVVAFMMDATVGRSLGEEDLLNLMNTVINQTINVMSQTQLKEMTAKIESNIPIEHLLEDKMELPLIQLVSLNDGMIDTMVDESYYIKFDQDFLKSVSGELTTFN